MKIKRGIVSIIASLFFSLGLGECAVSYPTPICLPENVSISEPTTFSGEKYAVISTGASVRNKEEGLVDPIDKNAFWVSTVEVYNELLKNGYKPENIYVLYKDGRPPFDDLELLLESAKIRKEFDGSYNNIATAENFMALLDSLEDRVNPEDRFTIYINQHGSSLGTAHFEYDGSFTYGRDLGRILEGNESENILIVLGTCHAEAFANLVNHEAVIISCSKRDMLGWADKNFSFGSVLFEEMNDVKNDTNADGEVSPYEAFGPAKRRSINYRESIDRFLRDKYEGTGLPEQDLERMDLVPVYTERSD